MKPNIKMAGEKQSEKCVKNRGNDKNPEPTINK